MHFQCIIDTFFHTFHRETRHRSRSFSLRDAEEKTTRDTTAYRSAEQLFNEPARTCIVSGTRSHPQQSPPPPPLSPPLPPPFAHYSLEPSTTSAFRFCPRFSRRGLREPLSRTAGLSWPIRCLRSFRSQSALFFDAFNAGDHQQPALTISVVIKMWCFQVFEAFESLARGFRIKLFRM